METNDEGEITMKIVVEHIKGLEAGSGNNVWVGADKSWRDDAETYCRSTGGWSP